MNPPPPHHSDRASGQLNDYDNYHEHAPPWWNPYLGAHGTTPKLPLFHRAFPPRGTGKHYTTTAYLACSQAMIDLNALWKTLDPPTRATWNPRAKRLRLPPFTTFMRENLRRAINHLPFISTPNE